MRTKILAVVVGAMVLAAARGSAEGSPLWGRGALRVGGFFTDSDSSVRVDAGSSRPGTPTNLERDFGLSAKRTVARGGLSVFLAPRHELSVRHFALSRSGSQRIDDRFVVGGTTFPPGITVEARLDLEQTELAYTAWAVRRPTFGAGLSLGLLRLSAEVEAAAQLRLAGVLLEARERAGESVAAPLVGVSLRGLVAPRFILSGDVRLLPQVEIGDTSGDLAVGEVAAEWRALPSLGILIGFERTRLRLDIDASDWRGSADLTTQGPTASLRWSW